MHHPIAREASTLAVGELEIALASDWSNTHVEPGWGNDLVQFDGELIRSALRVRTGICDDVDLEIEIPTLTAGPGHLDSFVREFHEVFGFPNRKRDSLPEDSFQMRALKWSSADNRYVTVYELEPDGVELGDIPITLTWSPLRFGSLRAGLQAGIELPTGREELGYGNGEIDTMVGGLVEWSVPGFSAFLWGGYTFAGTPERARSRGLTYSDVRSAGLGFEVGVTSWLTGLVQAEYETTVLRKLDSENAGSEHLMLWLGTRVRFTDNIDLEVALSEDVILNVAPDIAFRAGLRLRL